MVIRRGQRRGKKPGCLGKNALVVFHDKKKSTQQMIIVNFWKQYVNAVKSFAGFSGAIVLKPVGDVTLHPS